jgi:protein-L-isoaspartate(D-aspartate) O-methyltransferase
MMSGMSRDLARVRVEYAERIRALAGVRSEALVRAFATLPREDFVGPGPWQILRADAVGRGYEATPDADPRLIYDNVLVALDPARQLNNGEPASLARWLDSLELTPGERFLHVGCGVGYYTAIAAFALRPGGSAVGLEIDPDLAARARANLEATDANARIATDAAEIANETFDAIFVNAGATRPEASWLDALRPDGRLLLPLTVDTDRPTLGIGMMLLVRRAADGWPARFTSPVGVFHCAGARSSGENDALLDALRGGGHEAVRRLRRDDHAAGADCWLHGAGFCLSRRS